MNTAFKTSAAVATLCAMTLVSASALASPNSVGEDIRAVIGTNNSVRTFVDGDTVTLTGYFADAGDKTAALHAVNSAEGVEKVIDLTSVSN